jgi:ssDNA-binding Zn-finger/Zn-ribbon topoisomerase 1
MTQLGIECPQCGKHSLIQRTSDVYVCLNCDFKKDFAAPPSKKANANLWVFLGILALLLLARSLHQSPESATSPQPSLAPTVPATP